MNIVRNHRVRTSLFWPIDREVGAAGAYSRVPPSVGSSFLGIIPHAQPDVILRRVSSRVDGMMGVILLKDSLGPLPLCQTLEDPWNNNARGASCIPAGVYNCALTKTPHFGVVYEVLSVPGRDAILFHWGNTNRDTEGCIILGKEFGFLNGLVAVLESRAAFDRFMARMHGAPQFVLQIDDAWGGSTAIKS